jgi:hypothetical protein
MNISTEDLAGELQVDHSVPKDRSGARGRTALKNIRSEGSSPVERTNGGIVLGVQQERLSKSFVPTPSAPEWGKLMKLGLGLPPNRS